MFVLQDYELLSVVYDVGAVRHTLALAIIIVIARTISVTTFLHGPYKRKLI